jgi:unsaturated pyranuronate lyase
MRTAVSTVVLCIACIGAASLPAANTTVADSPAKKLVIVSRHADVAGVVVSSIEGKPMHGTLVLKPMLKGEQMTLLELHYQPGTKAPLHTHSHESIIYVVSGRVRTWIGDDVYDLGPGDVARHPAGALHTVEALVESTIIEIKSPAPDIATFIRAREK